MLRVHGQVGDAQGGLRERLEPVHGDRGPHLIEDALHQAEVQSAHHVLVVLGYLTERAVAQPDSVLRTSDPDLRRVPISSRVPASPCTAWSASTRS